MSKLNNALGRKMDRVFRVVDGPDFQAEWSKRTWPDSPSKVVLIPNDGVVFVGIVAADGQARHGYLLDADDAIQLGLGLQQHGTLAKSFGDIQ